MQEPAEKNTNFKSDTKTKKCVISKNFAEIFE